MKRSAKRFAALIVGLVILVGFLGQHDPVTSTPAPFQPNQRIGINFISAPGTTFANQAQRYAQASEAGAAWSRWPMYWNQLESQCNGIPDWSQSDGVVAGDSSHGLSIDAILLGTPSCYATTYGAPRLLPLVPRARSGFQAMAGSAISPPSGLYLPTFADGTDTLGFSKAINPANPWARFVNSAVGRYHGKIQNWEIWNEPDYSTFWIGTLPDYVRLLQVAYLAAHAADSNARILVGGMMYWQWANQYGEQAWLKQFLAQVTADPAASANGFYFDIIPWHFYSRSSDVFDHALTAQAALASYGVNGKELWLNETNAPACDDQILINGTIRVDPCFTNGVPSPGFANLTEQASYAIQSTSLAFVSGVTRVFEFQLQDDGNGQAFGMFRNNGTARPLDVAFALTSQYLGGYAVARRSVAGSTEEITFGVPTGTPHRTTVLWNASGVSTVASVPGAAVLPTSVTLVQQDGSSQALTPSSSYLVPLGPATDAHNFDQPWNPTDFVVGGPTAFLVEYLPPDVTAPVSAVDALPLLDSPLGFSVTWRGSDPNGWGVLDYTIQYRDLTIGGPWVIWLTNTTLRGAQFGPTPNHAYQFRSLARDWAGNVEAKDVTQFDAATSAAAPPIQAYLPLVGK